jgi:hypothetical protein
MANDAGRFEGHTATSNPDLRARSLHQLGETCMWRVPKDADGLRSASSTGQGSDHRGSSYSGRWKLTSTT